MRVWYKFGGFVYDKSGLGVVVPSDAPAYWISASGAIDNQDLIAVAPETDTEIKLLATRAQQNKRRKK